MSAQERFGFAAEDDAPIPYMQRVRDYYQALGYGAPYRWAHYAAVPFQPLPKPLAECRIALITTAAPYQPDKGEQGPGAAYNAAAKFYRVYSGDSARSITICGSPMSPTTGRTPPPRTPTPGFRCAQLRHTAAAGRIGELAPRFHGMPTNRSQRATLEQDCPELLARCRADRVDAAILVAN